jgi:hypothetical protein
MSKFFSLLSGFIGGFIGFIVGGPMGAWIGFGVGLGIATMIDPMVPDMPQVGDPMGDLEIMSIEEGAPLSDVLGTTKLTGTLLYYGGNRRVEVTEDVNGGGSGGGGDDEQVTGYIYFLSWAMVFCLGPIDTLYTIWMDDDIVWAGNIGIEDTTNGLVSVALWKGDRSPLEGYEDEDGKFTGGLPIFFFKNYEQGYLGIAQFYFGTDTQTYNSSLASLMNEEGSITDTTWAVPYRRQCYAYMHDCVIGDFNRCPTVKVVIRKAPECSFDT